MNTKHYTVSLLLLFLLSSFLSSTFSQTKKEVQFTLDTLYKSHLKLQNDYKALKKSWYEYDAFLTFIKSTTLDKEYVNESPQSVKELFDEVWTETKNDLTSFEDSSIFLLDSLTRLKEEYVRVMQQNKDYLRLLIGELDESSFPNTSNEFIGEWSLFLSPIQLSGDTFNSGIISYNPFSMADSLQDNNIYRIEFLQDELANIFFKDGRKQKSFYTINNFNVANPYSITFQKQDEFKLTMHVSPMPDGLQVSYETPLDSEQVLYFYGVMKP